MFNEVREPNGLYCDIALRGPSVLAETFFTPSTRDGRARVAPRAHRERDIERAEIRFQSITGCACCLLAQCVIHEQVAET